MLTTLYALDHGSSHVEKTEIKIVIAWQLEANEILIRYQS